MKLNVGCGLDIRPGWVNMDIADMPGVNVVHDLQVIPYPFQDAQFDEIVCRDVLEHVDFPRVLREIHRVAAPGCQVHIRVPHFTSKDAFSDPTHIRCFTVDTFRFFTKDHMRSYYFDFSFSKIVSIEIGFQCRPGYPWNYLIQPLVNASATTRNFYEGSPLRIFPAHVITAVLQK